ncbi:hypothetical protein [Botrimarina sp.]|uniref:hypothetical protein n=1 Tax=Botrimarina sp. TaxID=2795802 RepID=UPI0032EC0C2E
MNKPATKRKIKYVDPEVQGALARRMALHWLLFIALAATLVVGLRWLVDPFTPFADHLRSAWRVYGPLLIVLLSLAPLFIYDAIKLSNKFAGPMARFRDATRALARGEDPGPIELRRGDFWHDVAADFNAMIQRVNHRAPSDNEADSQASR